MDEQGAWCEQKYKLLGLYFKLFARGMKFKWDQRVFIDLYAGAGVAKIRGTGKLVMGSPLIALNLPDPFDAYVFCEKEAEKLKALRLRAEKIVPPRKIDFVEGDCNASVETILGKIPRGSSERKVLSLCCVDPFDIGIRFSTIRRLSSRYVDFLVLLAVYMDANRAYVHYLKPENKRVDAFLGLSDWRKTWEQEKFSTKFPEFLARQYSQQMTRLGYLQQDLYKMKRVRSDEKNLPLYRVALFSRNPIAYALWDQVLKYSTDPLLF